MMTYLTQSKKQNKKGFALLFTVLIVSLILSIAIGIANLTLKQAMLSNLVKDSQAAFYQADSAVECGIYQDTVVGAFSFGSIVPDTGDIFSSDGVINTLIGDLLSLDTGIGDTNESAPVNAPFSSPDTEINTMTNESTSITPPNLLSGGIVVDDTPPIDDDTPADDTPPIDDSPVAPPESFFCGSTLMKFQDDGSGSPIFTYRPASPVDSAPCFTIVFDKSNTQIHTKIQGYGYNVCAATSRQVERAIEVTY